MAFANHTSLRPFSGSGLTWLGIWLGNVPKLGSDMAHIADMTSANKPYFKGFSLI
jgi:hypothetical protein